MEVTQRSEGGGVIDPSPFLCLREHPAPVGEPDGLTPSGRLSVQGTPPLTIDGILTEPATRHRRIAGTAEPPTSALHSDRMMGMAQPAPPITQATPMPPAPFPLAHRRTTSGRFHDDAPRRVEVARPAFLSDCASAIWSQSGGSRPPMHHDHTSTARNQGNSSTEGLDVE